jgi:hypothetical protein
MAEWEQAPVIEDEIPLWQQAPIVGSQAEVPAWQQAPEVTAPEVTAPEVTDLPPEERRLQEILEQHRGEAPPPSAPSFAEEVPGPANIVYPPSKVTETEQQLEETRIPFEPPPKPDWTERVLEAFQQEGVGGAVRETGAALERAGITPDLPQKIAELDFGASPMPLLQTSGMGTYAPWGGGMAPREERPAQDLGQLTVKTAWNIAAGIYNFMNTPEGVATTIATGGLTAGGPVAKEAAKLVTLGFTSQMVKGAIDHAMQGDFQGMLESLGMAGILGKATHEMGRPAKAEPRTTTKGLEKISPGVIVGFRGEPKGPSSAGQAHGVGTYYGLSEDVANRFSREGTVKQESVNLQNPLVISSDAELRQAREAAGVNPDPRLLLSKPESETFTNRIQGQGYDGVILNYDQAPGGKQAVVFPRPPEAPVNAAKAAEVEKVTTEQKWIERGDPSVPQEAPAPVRNRLDAAGALAAARLRQRLAELQGPLLVPDPGILADAATVGAAIVGRGIRQDMAWGRAFLHEFGPDAEKLKPYLKDIYRASIVKHDQELQDYQRSRALTGEEALREAQQPTSKYAPPRPREQVKVDALTALKRMFGAAEKAGKAGRKIGYREAALKGQTEIRDMQKILRTSDAWLSAEAATVGKQLQAFAGYLPLNERAKFIPQILAAVRQPSQFAFKRDPQIMRRRAENVLNNITKAVYDYTKKDIVQKTQASLRRIKKSQSITVPERMAIQNLENQFNRFKDRMSLEMLQKKRADIAELEERGRHLFREDKAERIYKTEKALRDIAKQGTLKRDRYTPERPELGEALAWQAKQRNWLRRIPHASNYFNMAWTPMDWLFTLFDQRESGALYRNLKLPYDSVHSDYLDIATSYKKRLVDIWNKHNLDEKNSARIAVYAELQQAGGYENLKASGYTDAEINSARTLTRPELEYYRAGRKAFDEWFPRVQEVMATQFHKTIKAEPNYWPRVRDWEQYDLLSIEDGKFADQYRRTSSAPGSLIERKPDAVSKNLYDAHQTAMNHIDDMVRHAVTGPELKRIADLVRSDEFKAQVGEWGRSQFADWVDVLARNGGVGTRHQWANILRQNVGIMQLGWRVTTMALQPVALIQAMPFITWRNTGHALTSMLKGESRKWVLDNFPEVRETLVDDPAYAGYTGKNVRDILARQAFKPISWLDGFARIQVAEAAYRDYLEKRGLPFDRNNINKDARDYAQRIVRITQATSFPKDAPLALSHGNFTGDVAIDRLIGQFSNYILNRWSLMKHAGLQMGIKEKNYVAGARVMAYVLLSGIIEQLGREGIANLTRMSFGEGAEQERRRKKEEEEKSLWRRIAERSAVDMLTSAPGVTNISGMLRYNSSGIPVYDTLRRTVLEVSNIWRGKTPTRKIIGGVRAAQYIGGASGLPTGQIGDLAVRWLQDYERRHGPIRTVPVTTGTSYERQTREPGTVPATR